MSNIGASRLSGGAHKAVIDATVEALLPFMDGGSRAAPLLLMLNHKVFRDVLSHWATLISSTGVTVEVADVRAPASAGPRRAPPDNASHGIRAAIAIPVTPKMQYQALLENLRRMFVYIRQQHAVMRADAQRADGKILAARKRLGELVRPSAKEEHGKALAEAEVRLKSLHDAIKEGDAVDVVMARLEDQVKSVESIPVAANTPGFATRATMLQKVLDAVLETYPQVSSSGCARARVCVCFR